MSLTVFFALCILGIDFMIYFFFKLVYGEKRRAKRRRLPPGYYNDGLPERRLCSLCSVAARKAKRTLQSASSLCLRVMSLQPRIIRFIPGATKALWPGIRVPAWATVVIVPSLYANTPMSPVDVIPSKVIWPAALIVAELALKRDPPGAASPGPAMRVRAP